MPRIIIFTTKNSLKWAKEVDSLPHEPCEFIFTVYDSLQHLQEIFLDKIKQVDGILFSGQIPYFFIKKTFANVDLPMTHFDVTNTDFYRVLSEYMYQHSDFKMKRCLIDFLYEENNYLEIKDWTDPDDFPYIYSSRMEAYADLDIYDKIRERHLELWKEKKVDVTMTRLSSLPELLEPDGVNVLLVVPSKRSMLEKVEELLKEVRLVHLTQNQVVIAHVEFSLPRDNMRELDYRKMSLYKAIMDFEKRNSMNFIIHQSSLNFEIITSYADFTEITNNSTSCSLVSFLSKELPFPIRVGWGVGHTIQGAQLNAGKAASMGSTSESQSYILDDGKMIGPLGNEHCIQVSTTVDSTIEELSNKLHTSPLQIRKILAVMSKLQTNLLASEDLSTHLGITERAATRILKKLEENGAAKVSSQQQKKLRGRPKKVYEILF